MKVLLDTNVVLDLFLKRQPWHQVAHELMVHHLRKNISIHLTTLTLANMAYVARNYLAEDRIKHDLRICLQQLIILPIASSTLLLSLTLKGNDIEDNIQAAAVQEAQLDVIVTRDQTGFKTIAMKVLTPTELLRLLPSL